MDGEIVKIYSCGPTVYSSPTIGNLRAYIFTDILKKSLRHIGGFEIYDVINITDVGHLQSDADEGEDKIDEAARKKKITPADIAKQYTDEFIRDTILLNIDVPQIWAPATDYVKEMVQHVRQLEERGFTYITSDGVYYDSSKFADYYKLRGGKSDDRVGSRVDFGEKRNKNDFCLWRFAKPTALQKFDSPWGAGTPGWHIECSAIARKYLGDQFDIHTGGVDHIPIHHTNERAQTQALTKKEMARFWMHNEFIKINGTKMSKSLGNAYTLTNLTDRGYSPLHFRYLCLMTHYRTIMNFTWESLDSAKKSYENLVRQIKKNKVPVDADEFSSALVDDLNTAKAMAALWKATPEQALEFDKVLSLGLKEALEEKFMEIPENVAELVQIRAECKKNREFQKSDQIRDEIKALGYEVLDTSNGPIIQPIR